MALRLVQCVKEYAHIIIIRYRRIAWEKNLENNSWCCIYNVGWWSCELFI